MIRNFNVEVKDFRGQALKDAQGNQRMMADVIGAQLFNAGGKEAMPADDKMRAYRLCVQMREHPERVEMTTEDATLIKKVAADGYVAGVYGQVVEIIEELGVRD